MIDLVSALPALEAKIRRLSALLAPCDRIGIAFSGGVDSSLLAWFAHAWLKKKVFVFFAESGFASGSDRRNAARVAEEIGLPLEIVPVDVFSIEALRDNPPRRCYFCKKELLSRIRMKAAESGCDILFDGSHAGDALGYRPGKQALEESGVVSPLAEAGLDKDDIRRISRIARLSTWDRPTQSCLATRIPYGVRLTAELLSAVDRGEDFLRTLGCAQVRVRVHGELARIEVDPPSLPVIMRDGNRTEAVRVFKALGFKFVTVDLAGFRSGSWDEGLH